MGIDFAGQMVRKARAKVTAAGRRVALLQADAEAPPLRNASLDAVLARHVLWALSDADVAVQRWLSLLRPDGVIVLVEGRWWTGAGLSARELEEVVGRHRHHVEVVPLHDPALWGKPVDDERYLLVSHS